MSGFSLFESLKLTLDQRIDVDAEVLRPPINVLAGVLESGVVVWPECFVEPTDMEPDRCFGHSPTTCVKFLNSGDECRFAILWGRKF